MKRIITPDVPYDTSVSRQRRWQRRKAAAQCCVLCGEPLNLYATYCDAHAAAHLRMDRKRNGVKAHALTYFTGRKKRR